jgi:hypothetical protein
MTGECHCRRCHRKMEIIAFRADEPCGWLCVWCYFLWQPELECLTPKYA